MFICGLLTIWIASSDVDGDVSQYNRKKQDRWEGMCQDGIVKAAVDHAHKPCQQSLLKPLNKSQRFH